MTHNQVISAWYSSHTASLARAPLPIALFPLVIWRLSRFRINSGLVFFFVVLGTKSRAQAMLGKHCPTALYSQPNYVCVYDGVVFLGIG